MAKPLGLKYVLVPAPWVPAKPLGLKYDLVPAPWVPAKPLGLKYDLVPAPWVPAPWAPAPWVLVPNTSRIQNKEVYATLCLQALGRMGKIDQALFVLRHCYGGMIALGATTFWETFVQAPEYISSNIPWATGALPTHVPWSWSGVTSLCHPWAAGTIPLACYPCLSRSKHRTVYCAFRWVPLI